jgi:hypothetical protein
MTRLLATYWYKNLNLIFEHPAIINLESLSHSRHSLIPLQSHNQATMPLMVVHDLSISILFQFYLTRVSLQVVSFAVLWKREN